LRSIPSYRRERTTAITAATWRRRPAALPKQERAADGPIVEAMVGTTAMALACSPSMTALRPAPGRPVTEAQDPAAYQNGEAVRIRSAFATTAR
jgi:hypothetical protein